MGIQSSSYNYEVYFIMLGGMGKEILYVELVIIDILSDPYHKVPAAISEV